MRQILEKEMIQRNMNQKELASFVGITGASLTKYLKGEIGIKFESALKIIQILFPDRENEMMREYIKTSRLQDARYGLEYSYDNGMYDLFEQKLEELSESINTIDQEWVQVYTLVNARRKKLLSPEEIITKAKKLKATTSEMIFRKILVKISGLYEGKKFEHITDYLDEAEYELQQIKCDYIRHSYEVRLGQIVAHIALRSNQVEKCREYCSLILTKARRTLTKASIYHTLGHSYLYESYEKAINNLFTALELYKELGKDVYIQECIDSINFIMNHYGVFPQFLDFDRMNIESHHEVVHYHIKRNELKKAQDLLLKIDLSNLTRSSIGYHYYYRGLAFQENDYLFESIYHFNCLGDFFFAELPRQELRSRGVSVSVLKATLGKGVVS